MGGKVPIIVKEMEIADEGKKLLVNECINEWLKSPHAQKLVKHDFWKRALHRHVSTSVGKMIAEYMIIAHWQPVFKKMRDNGSLTMATEILSKMKQIFSYSIRSGKLAANLLSELRADDVGMKPKAGRRYFSDKEIGMFWRAVDNTNMTKQSKLFIK